MNEEISPAQSKYVPTTAIEVSKDEYYKAIGPRDVIGSILNYWDNMFGYMTRHSMRNQDRAIGFTECNGMGRKKYWLTK